MVRLILTDIDETIMPKGDTQVPAHVIEAFHAAQDADSPEGHVFQVADRRRYDIQPPCHQINPLSFGPPS